ncbi:MAG: antibiotic biosynthesis monooxygenase [Actinobacteria bacterium]|nr:MAG: antibiotic biosynthesis monooxygenase [Actinomycetota bacterium]
MIIVTGVVHARPDNIDAVLAISLEHVRRSRREPGCLLHSVHQDVEDPLKVVFLEHWRDQAALVTHFGVAASRAFAKEITALADRPPVIDVYEAEAARL